MVVFVCDEGLVPHYSVALQSLFEHVSQDLSYRVVILPSNTEQSSQERLGEQLRMAEGYIKDFAPRIIISFDTTIEADGGRCGGFFRPSIGGPRQHAPLNSTHLSTARASQ